MLVRPAMTFAEIGEEMGVTHQRVQQIYAQAINKLRQRGMLPAFEAVVALHCRRQYAVPKGPSRAGRYE